jgi:hypothetical protein
MFSLLKLSSGCHPSVLNILEYKNSSEKSAFRKGTFPPPFRQSYVLSRTEAEFMKLSSGCHPSVLNILEYKNISEKSAYRKVTFPPPFCQSSRNRPLADVLFLGRTETEFMTIQFR